MSSTNSYNSNSNTISSNNKNTNSNKQIRKINQNQASNKTIKNNNPNNNLPKKLEIYLSFCEDLWKAYQTKHQEVIRYSSILDELVTESLKLESVDILKLKKFNKKYDVLYNLLKSKDLKSESIKLDELKKIQEEMLRKGEKNFSSINQNIQNLLGKYKSLNNNSLKKSKKNVSPRRNQNNNRSKKNKKSINLKKQMEDRMNMIKELIKKKESISRKRNKPVSPNEGQTLILERYYNKYIKNRDNEDFDEELAEDVKQYIDFLKNRNKLLKEKKSRQN